MLLFCSMAQAQTSAPVQNITYDLKTNPNRIVVSWVVEFNALTSTLTGTAFTSADDGSPRNPTTLDAITVNRSGTINAAGGFVTASKFQAEIPVSGANYALTPQMDAFVVKVSATGNDPQGSASGDGSLRINLDLVEKAFDNIATSEKNTAKVNELIQEVKNVSADRDLFRQFAADYPRRVRWRADSFNNVVVIKASSTYSAKVQAIATAADGSEKRGATTVLPAITETDVPITGLTENTPYTIRLVEVPTTPAPNPAPPALAFDPANSQVSTNNLPAPRVEFASAPINVRNALLKLPLQIRATSQLKIIIAEVKATGNTEKSAQTIALDSKFYQAKNLTDYTAEIPFEAKEGVVYQVKVQPLAPFQGTNLDQEQTQSFTGLRSLLADTVNIVFKPDSIEFSAKSIEFMRLEVQVQSAGNPNFTYTDAASTNPKFELKYTALPVATADGLPLVIGLKANDASGREQIQRITLQVAPPQVANQKVRKELITFGNEVTKAFAADPNNKPDTSKTLSVKSIASTGLGILLRALFPVIP